MSYFNRSLLLHLAVLALLALFYTATPPFEKRRVIHTSTVKLSSAVTTASQVQAAPPAPEAVQPTKKKEEAPAKPEKIAKKEPVKKEIVKTEPKKEIAKTEPKKEEKKKEVVKTDPKKDALLKEARDNLAKMGKVEATSTSVDKSNRSVLSSLKAEGMTFFVKGADNDLYTSELIARLKLALRLPESGEVIVDLTLLRNGRVAGIKIRDAKSSINKHYVEAHLPSLSFPEFGESYPNKDEKLFTLSLQNAIF